MTTATTGSGSLYFRVLGPLSVERQGEPLDLGGPQRRTVLALLVANANEVVSVDTMVDALWGETPPASYRVQLHGVVSNLRQRLAEQAGRTSAPILTHPQGYLLQIGPNQLDLARFRAGLTAGRAAAATGDHGAAVRLLRGALDHWRGPAYTGIAATGLHHHALAADEERWAATEELIDAQLADGAVSGLSAQLVRLVAEHPLRERLHDQLMSTYVRIGRRTDALDVYRAFRDRVVGELGIEPSAALQRLHRQILAADPTIEGEPTQTPATAYRHLPPDLPAFTGRRPELAAVLEATEQPPGDGVVIVSVEGMAGVGKTRLAVHAAHRLVALGRYPHGQLYVDLHGVSATGAPVDPADTLESFLRLLGVPADQMPADLAGRSAVFRDRLAGRQVLILLDNAADEDQLAPLIPASPTCAVLITSRGSLALDGAVRIGLDPFTEDEGMALLRTIVDARRVEAEPVAAGELIRLCGYLPLALALAAQRLRNRPAWPVAHLVSRLADERGRLDELAVSNRAVEAVLAQSYVALPTAQRRLFRLLAIHPGGDLAPASVAALADLDPGVAERMLESMYDQHLVQQTTVGRYRLHDLLRAYGMRLCAADPPQDREQALSRVLDWYVHAAGAAAIHLRPTRVPAAHEVPAAKAPLPVLGGPAAAMAWFDGEYANLVAAVHIAAGPWPAHAIELPHALAPYLMDRGYLADAQATLEVAAAAARQIGDVSAAALIDADLRSVAGAAPEAR